MTRMLYIVALLATLAPRTAAAELPADVKPILDRAIGAMGGAKALAKLRCYRIEEEGSAWQGKTKSTLVTITWEAPPDKVKFQQTQTEDKPSGPKTQTFLQVVAGESGWNQVVGEKAQDLDAEAVATVKGDMRSPRLQRLPELAMRPTGTVTRLASGRVDGKPVDRLQVQTKDLPNVVLSFATDTGLLVKSEARVPVGTMLVDREIFYHDYRPVGDLKYPHKQTIYVNGNRSLELEVKRIDLLEAIDPSEFQKPKS